MYNNKERLIIVDRVGRYIIYGDYYKFHRRQTTNRYATLGQWVVKDGKEFIDVREPIRTRVENMNVQLKVKILGINKDGSLNTSHFEQVQRGVIEGSGLNENQLINRFVVVEFSFLGLKRSHRNAEWRVVLILDQEEVFNINGLLYAEEKNTYRIHSKKFPLDFKIAKTRTASYTMLELGSLIEFGLPSNGVLVDSYRILNKKMSCVSIVNQTVIIQDSYYLDYKTSRMSLEHCHNVFDLSFSLEIYMRDLNLDVVNAYFRLTPYDSNKVMYVLEREQPFMESKTDGFKPSGENEDSVYSDKANSYKYDSSFNSTNNNNKCYGSYSDVVDDDESEFFGCGDNRGRKEAKVVTKIEQCKELIETADELVLALSPDSIGARLAREAEYIRSNLQHLPRDHGTLHHQMRYKKLEKEKERLNELIKLYEEAIRQAVLFLVEQDLVDQKETAQLVMCCFLADNF